MEIPDLMASLTNTTINDTGELQIPQGSISQRPSAPEEGMIRYNTELGVTEFYDGLSWKDMQTGNRIIAQRDLIVWVDPGNILSYTGTGTTIRDLSNNGNDGVFVNSPAFSDGNISLGSSDYVDFGNKTDFQPNNLTIEIWVNNDVVSDDWVISNQGGRTDYDNGFLIRTDSPSSTIFGYAGGRVSGTRYTYSTGNWLHVVLTYDNGDARFYVNNGLQDASSNDALTFNSVVGLRIGLSSEDSVGWLGDFGPFRMYGRALSPEEINEHFQTERNRFGV